MVKAVSHCCAQKQQQRKLISGDWSSSTSVRSQQGSTKPLYLGSSSADKIPVGPKTSAFPIIDPGLAESRGDPAKLPGTSQRIYPRGIQATDDRICVWIFNPFI